MVAPSGFPFPRLAMASEGEHVPSLQRVEKQRERWGSHCRCLSCQERGGRDPNKTTAKRSGPLPIYTPCLYRGGRRGDRWQTLMGQFHKIFDFRFFYESVSPKPPDLSIPLGPLRIFLKISGDIRSSRCITGVVRWHRRQMKKNFNQKSLNYFFGTPLCSRINIKINFFLQVHFKMSAVW